MSRFRPLSKWSIVSPIHRLQILEKKNQNIANSEEPSFADVMNNDSTLIKKDISGYGFALLATILWSGNYVIARGLHDQIPPISLASLRWAIAIFILLPFALRESHSDWGLIRKHLKYLCGTALLGITLLNTFVYIAGHSSEAINLSIITVASPVFTILFVSYIYKEPITKPRTIGLSLSISGIFVLISGGNILNILELRFSDGDIWILLSAMSFAGYSILVKNKPTEMGNKSFLLSVFLIGWLFLLPFHVWEHQTKGDWVLDIGLFGNLLYLAIGASIMAFFAWSKAVEYVGPSAAAVIYYSLPIFSSIEAAVLLGEELRVIHILSFLLIIIGIAIANRKKSPHLS